MFVRHLLSLSAVLCFLVVQFMTVGTALVQRHNELQIWNRGDWEEVTLVEEDGARWSRPRRWLSRAPWRKRQMYTSGQGTQNPPTTLGNNLTGVPTTGNIGAAGDNNAGVIPGQVGNEQSPQRDQGSCVDVTTTRNNSCWAILNVTEYVKTWVNKTVCGQGEGFANCFMRQNGFPGYDCGNIGTGASCPAISNPTAQQDPRLWYTALNIQGKRPRPFSTSTPLTEGQASTISSLAGTTPWG